MGVKGDGCQCYVLEVHVKTLAEDAASADRFLKSLKGPGAMCGPGSIWDACRARVAGQNGQSVAGQKGQGKGSGGGRECGEEVVGEWVYVDRSTEKVWGS